MSSSQPAKYAYLVSSAQARSTVWRVGVSSAPENLDGCWLDCKRTKVGNQENNAALFDHCNLTNLQLWLNHSRYPSVDMATDFTQEQYAGVIRFTILLADTMGIDNLLASSAVNPSAFKSLYPIHIF